mmetsp:Transcript_22949/g.45870  ORF Transcript_22949/g.45870 Transcript_22949/m.45870 type:complete len:152 (-) Transcript_22949:188-643(-)
MIMVAHYFSSFSSPTNTSHFHTHSSLFKSNQAVGKTPKLSKPIFCRNAPSKCTSLVYGRSTNRNASLGMPETMCFTPLGICSSGDKPGRFWMMAVYAIFFPPVWIGSRSMTLQGRRLVMSKSPRDIFHGIALVLVLELVLMDCALNFLSSS